MDNKIVASIVASLINVSDLDVIEKEDGSIVFFSPSRKIVLHYSTELFNSKLNLDNVMLEKAYSVNGWLCRGVLLRPQRTDPEIVMKVKKLVSI